MNGVATLWRQGDSSPPDVPSIVAHKKVKLLQVIHARNPEAEPARRCSASGASGVRRPSRSEEHTSELQSLMRISYAVFCLKKKTKSSIIKNTNLHTTATSLT